jgi:hypothetical protein
MEKGSADYVANPADLLLKFEALPLCGNAFGSFAESKIPHLDPSMAA